MKPDQLPRHVAIIMDGNGRWARARNLPRIMGHRRGAETVRMVVKACGEMGIEYLTLYAFSRENWKRPKAEVDALMAMLGRYIDKEMDELDREGVRFQTIGETELLPESVQKKIAAASRRTEGNRRLNLILALNYGSRQEILRAVRRVVSGADGTEALRRLAALDEKKFSAHLDTALFPDPDLLIRTSGEMRLSNFLLWQCSYAEIVVTPRLWPEFSKEDFLGAINEYSRRERRYGGL